MANKQLLDYVQKSVEAGYAIDQINGALLAQGWAAHDINEAVRTVQDMIQKRMVAVPVPPPAPKKSEWDIEVQHLSASQVLLYIGALIVIIAAITYVSINWSVWGAGARILAILLPTLICYAAGAAIFYKEGHKRQGAVFLTVGALLFPAFLTVAFHELRVFENLDVYYFGFAVSALSLVVYVLSSLAFRIPIWSFLYLVSGLFTYYFAMEVFEVGRHWGVEAMLWLFLIPGTVYMIAGALLNKKTENHGGHYAYVLGTLVVGITSLMLFTTTESNPAYSLVILGVLYFVTAAFLERSGNTEYCKAPYAVGTALVFFALFQIAALGTWVQDITGEDLTGDQQIIGWSNVLLGVIYLALGWFLPQLKQIGLNIGSNAGLLFIWVGPLWVLGGLHFLGLNGNHFILESLLLIVSLGFIFISVPSKQKTFLLSGTLFLVIYIFSIGGEYFQNEVGWPITLFVAGLLSMIIGVATERIRRTYFTAKNL